MQFVAYVRLGVWKASFFERLYEGSPFSLLTRFVLVIYLPSSFSIRYDPVRQSRKWIARTASCKEAGERLQFKYTDAPKPLGHAPHIPHLLDFLRVNDQLHPNSQNS